MSLGDRVRALLALRDSLPDLLGARWHDDGEAVTERFTRLEAATTEPEQEAAIDALVVSLMRFPGARAALRRALEAGDPAPPVDRLSFEDSPPSAAAPAGSAPAAPPTPPVPAGSASAAPPAEPRPVLERWPHMDIDVVEPIAACAEFDLHVYANTTSPRSGETGSALVLPNRPEIQLQVMLVTSGQFTADGPTSATITITRDARDSTTATFHLRTVDGASGRGAISAWFACDGRPAGSVTREMDLSGATVPSAAATTAPVLRLDEAAQRPGLTVHVHPVPGSGGRRFACTVSTTLIDGYADGVTALWDLPDAADKVVAGYMESFTKPGLSNDARRAALLGAGRKLFRAAPENFRQAFWAIQDAGTQLDTVLVATAEPYVPWELMVPNEGARTEDLPLGVTRAVGRWVHQHQLGARQAIALANSYIIAPTYRGAKALTFSADEAQFVIESFSGKQIPATFTSIESELGAGGAALLHFICHGNDTGPSGQTIDLDPDETLSDTMLEGMPGVERALRSKEPMVFINACQVGRPTPALVGTGGFASAFIELGARCVIAPIWSVKDSVAAQVARNFYGEVKRHPERPFAGILRDLRKRAYEGPGPEDSWAAYSFYGDPLASAASNGGTP